MEEQKEQDEAIDDNEIQRILSEAEELKDAEGDTTGNLKIKLKDKKVLIGAVILLLLIGCGIYWFLLSELKPSKEEPVESVQDQDPPIKKGEVEEVPRFKRISVYPLKSFFIPLELENSELGQFVSIKITFVLSNSKLDKEVKKNIGEIRKQIYEILKGKKSIIYIENRVEIKEQLKQEITSASNNLLASGTGVISEVLFTDFIIK